MILYNKMKQKILSFVVCDGKFLALRNNPHPEHGGDFWFTVTGAVEEGESLKDAVKREIKEETNLDVKDIINLNWSSIYEWRNEVCEEANFIAFVNHGQVKLNEEHNKFEWTELDKFIETIKWDDKKEILKEVLKKALKKELHFKERNIKDYRKNGKNK